MAKSFLRRSISKTATGPSNDGGASMSSESIRLLAMPTTRSSRFTLGVVRTRSGGNSWVFSPGTSTNFLSPTISIQRPYLLIDNQVANLHLMDAGGVYHVTNRRSAQQLRTILQDLLLLVKR